MDRKDSKRIVELVTSDDQPTKAELEEELEPLDIPGRMVDQRMKKLVRALSQLVKLRRTDRPRKRR